MFKITLLSISLLTIMAGAAVAPGLSAIARAFPYISDTTLKMIITLPSLIIIPASIVTGIILSKSLFTRKTVLVLGLILCSIGGISPFFCHEIETVFIFRAVLGIGTGIIIPLSTGLIDDCFQGEERAKMMGFSFAANNMGAILGNMGAGFLVTGGWQKMFLLYLVAVVVLILVLVCVRHLPQNTKQPQKKTPLPTRDFGM